MVFVPINDSIIQNDSIPTDKNYQDIKIIRCQSNPEELENFRANRYQFQHEPTERTPFKCVLSRKGFEPNYRIIATVHPSMKLFLDLVKYDPSDPKPDDYNALGMKKAHDSTQQDFKGQKKANTVDFANYIIEGIKGERNLYLPIINGWQSKNVFKKTIFVAFDEENENAMYGILYLPKAPIMQADGQTQTAAIFRVAKSQEANTSTAFSQLQLTLEIELNLDEDQAGQSFADRNGRGSNKNKNLIKGLDLSSAMSSLRNKSIKETIFVDRIAKGRSGGITETSTQNIVDLSALEQMLLGVISNGKKKPEHIKHHYIPYFLPHCHEFLVLLEKLFAKDWLHPSPPNTEPFRKLYVHGWAFCLKALALAYHRVKIRELAPLASAIGTEHKVTDPSKSIEEKYKFQVEEEKQKMNDYPLISYDEFVERLERIDWLRYRKHWITLTGYKTSKGQKRTLTLKGSNITVVAAQAQNTKTVIESVCDKILSDSWEDLCSQENEPF